MDGEAAIFTPAVLAQPSMHTPWSDGLQNALTPWLHVVLLEARCVTMS